MNNKNNNNMKLQDYLQMNSRFTRMEKSIDVWSIDYNLEKLLPLIKDGFDYDDIAQFILVRWDNFVHGGRLDELLEQDKLQKGEK
jgi:hypothetical protein